jgi:hypothetical protein
MFSDTMIFFIYKPIFELSIASCGNNAKFYHAVNIIEKDQCEPDLRHLRRNKFEKAEELYQSLRKYSNTITVFSIPFLFIYT